MQMQNHSVWLFPITDHTKFLQEKKIPLQMNPWSNIIEYTRKESTTNKGKQTQSTGGLAFSKLELKEQLKKDYKINIFKIIEETKGKLEFIRKYQETM